MSKHKEADAAINNSAFFSSLVGNQIHDSHNVINNDVLFVEPNKEYQFYCSDCTKPEVSIGYVHDNKKHLEYENPEFTYKFNNHRFRCDDFSSEDAPKNYLFSGCSNTMGVGLPESSTWAYVLNNYLSGDKFFNLGTGGASCQQIVQDIYKYINLFGKPKAIFILFPNLERFNRIMYFNDKGSVFLETEHFNLFPPTDLKGKIKEFNNYETQFFNFYNMMTAFELYCKEAGITLHWATWDEKLNITCSGFSKYFNNYLDLNLNKVIKTRTKINELFSKKYSRLARDTEHFGTITQDWIFESFKKRVQNEI